MKKLKMYLLFSQVSLFTCLVICSIILPSVVIKEGGVSNFGNHTPTVWIYTLGFLLNITFIYLAAGSITKLSNRLAYMTRALWLLCFLIFLVFLSTFPRHYSFTFSYIHDYLGIALFLYEFLISIYLVKKQGSYLSISWLIIESIGSLVGLLSVSKIIHWLYIGQIIGSLGFGLIFVVLLPKVIEKEADNPNKRNSVE